MIWIAVLLIVLGTFVIIWSSGNLPGLLFGLALITLGATMITRPVFGRDLDGRYANSPLKPWFDQLKSGKGPCCSDSDGYVVKDADWKTRDGQYQVYLEGEWRDVPPDAVITEPNLFGRTMVWPIKGWGGLTIRCFMPGSMT